MPQLVLLVLVLLVIKLFLDAIKPDQAGKSNSRPGDFIDISKKWIQADALPYRPQAGLLDNAALELWNSLHALLQNSSYAVYPSVHLADVVLVPSGTANRTEYQLRIDKRRLDLLLAEAPRLQPRLAILFVSQADKGQTAADPFTIQALTAAGIGHLAIDPSQPPDPADLRSALVRQGLNL